jgi:hypothetical protein
LSVCVAFLTAIKVAVLGIERVPIGVTRGPGETTGDTVDASLSIWKSHEETVKTAVPMKSTLTMNELIMQSDVTLGAGPVPYLLPFSPAMRSGHSTSRADKLNCNNKLSVEANPRNRVSVEMKRMNSEG